MEMGFYTDEVFPIANRVRYIASALDIFTVVRIYFGKEGLFVALDSGEPVEPVAEAVEAVHRAE